LVFAAIFGPVAVFVAVAVAAAAAVVAAIAVSDYDSAPSIRLAHMKIISRTGADRRSARSPRQRDATTNVGPVKSRANIADSDKPSHRVCINRRREHSLACADSGRMRAHRAHLAHARRINAKLIGWN